ncbi:TonB-dependent receptor [Sphingomonas cannabina]|uniref:TonB-dependent receptor n=1 Tax=Sphingomonas cannabina TaxID=2899123 RepID=UPI001F25A225|nr:TonB-dependent receptor [Sphingomonas cannabina]UIJ46553.1 TonB-dependent receptor [Sphingomonas cannabina]
MRAIDGGWTNNSAGNPVGGGDKVKANNTFDLHVQYEFQGDNFARGWQVYVDAQNIFDKNPPFYNGNTAGILGGAWAITASCRTRSAGLFPWACASGCNPLPGSAARAVGSGAWLLRSPTA